MKRISLGKTGIETSALGFGCASLGSRVSAKDGLRAMAAAHDRGLAWFDLAPAYGRGVAEEIAAEFFRGRRDQVGLCTKVGLAPPKSTGGIKGMVTRRLIHVARQMVGTVPGLREKLRKSGMQTNQKQPLTPELLRESLEGSLRRLGTDYVDLYALHNATVEEIARDDILRALEDILTSGKARAVAVASGTDVAAACIARGAPFGAAQFALPAPDTPSPSALFDAGRAAGMGTLAHSVMGVDGVLADISRRMETNANLRGAVAALGGDPASALGRVLVARALTLNPDGVVLVSMFSDRSLAANVGTVEAMGDPALAAAVTAIEKLGPAGTAAAGAKVECPSRG
ncbi:aldo/keto reductase [Xanthobacter autotrophicus]|uniref:aldo/keto reductase n=1 Tax=Xanthobacter autotrophicus TaxID=280 RepID=UPI0024A6BB12|nr:aldo/keto reductase [Xanthobacter autotrophicus]MDI4658578.1 aldo/keto reductase [Xanthobacter autotrophicus]